MYIRSFSLLIILTLLSITSCKDFFRKKITPCTSLVDKTEVRLNKKFYNYDDLVSATVQLAPDDPPVHSFVIFVSPETGDAEMLQLEQHTECSLTTTGKLQVQSNGSFQKNDGILSVKDGEVITAYYYSDKRDDSESENSDKVSVAADFAFIRSRENLSTELLVDKTYALTNDEEASNAATLLVEGQIPLQIARNQVIFYGKDKIQLIEFMKFSKGKLKGEWKYQNGAAGEAAYLVEVPLDDVKINDLGQLRTFIGLEERIFTSDVSALKLALFCAMANLSGFQVSLNPRMISTSTPTDKAESVWANPPGNAERIPPSFIDNRTNIIKTWNFMSIWDRDNARIRVGIIDHGFHTNNDYRDAASMTECEANPFGIRCGNGLAQGIPTAGGFLGTGQVWHGNGVQARSCGVLNNNFGTAGTGGQVSVPMITKMSGVEAYAFNIGGSIRTAVDNGAQVINVSGGFPCSALTALGNFNHCDPVSRGAACAALFPIVQSGAVIACSLLNVIPFIGRALSAICLATASSVYVSSCVSQFAAGNPGQVISQAVQYAKRNGVPVVASAGNFIDPSLVPEPLRSFVNLDQNRMTVEEWQVVPAVLPDVICVGAASPSTPYENEHVFGDRVDVWAPQDGYYMAPASTTIPGGPGNPDQLDFSFSASSSAAPFVTGLIANAMAINPQLDPARSSNVEFIVDNISTLIRTSAWPSGSLPATSLGRRRNLINPIEFLKAAAASIGSTIPVVSSSVYLDAWNLEADENTNDRPISPTELIYQRSGVTRAGSIIHIPGTNGANAINDVDHYRIRIPSGYQPIQGERITISLRTPRSSTLGDLIVAGTDIRFSQRQLWGANEEIKRYSGPDIQPGAIINFRVGGSNFDQDNIYQLTIGNVVIPPPAPTAVMVSLNNIIEELCPNRLERGDHELGGGPLMNMTVELQVTPDQRGLNAIVNFRVEETKDDRSTFTGSFTRRVYTAPAGRRILSNGLVSQRSEVRDHRGRSAGPEFGGCNEGQIEEPRISGNLVRYVKAVGDTGHVDYTPERGCGCDSNIKEIRFNQARIFMEQI